ncbi:ATPase [Micromonospora sp. BRA006-A]|nr:ATPase [Micromonospora sp. BRA006-A]
MSGADAVVRRQIVVDAPVERAFAVFTKRFGDFKPKEHNLLSSPITETVFEAKAGGHIVDRAEDGSECAWARILVFEPPDRLVFSWDISPAAARTGSGECQRGRGPVRRRDTAAHPGRVGAPQPGPARSGVESVRDGVGHDEGWPLYLARFAGLFTEAG